MFDAVAQVIAQTGVLGGKRKRVIDSTVLDDAVATQDTVTQLTAAIRKVARVVPGADRGDRRGVHAGLLAAGQAGDRLGRPAGEDRAWSVTW